jgi:predicted nucleotidyltransferase
MYDQSAVINIVRQFVLELTTAGYNPEVVFLFGSYANGKPSIWSDIDVAVWDEKFSGCLPLDVEDLKSLLSKFSNIELHTFSLEDQESPLIREIRQSGICIYSSSVKTC